MSLNLLYAILLVVVPSVFAFIAGVLVKTSTVVDAMRKQGWRPAPDPAQELLEKIAFAMSQGGDDEL